MKLLNDVKTTCDLLSIARSTLDEEIKRGNIAPVRRGKRVFFHIDEINRYVGALPQRLARPDKR